MFMKVFEFLCLKKTEENLKSSSLFLAEVRPLDILIGQAAAD